MELPAIFRGARRRLFAWLLANAAAQAGMLFLNAMIIRYAFDHFLTGGDIQLNEVAVVAAVMVLVALETGWLQGRERILAEKLGQSYIHSMRMRLFRHVSRLDPRQLQKKRRGAVMLKFIGDLNALRRWVSLGLVRIVVSGAIIVSTLTILLLIDWMLSLAVAAIIAGGIVANVHIGKMLRDAARETRKRRSRLSANINEKLSRMSVVQVFGRRDREIRKVRRQSYHLRRALTDRAAKIGLIRGVNHGSTSLCVTVVLIIGIFQVHAGHTTPGTIAAAMIVLGFLVPALKNLGRVYEYYSEALVARQKLGQFMKLRPRIKLGPSLPGLKPGPGRLTLEGLNVKGVLNDVAAEAAAGEVIAVVGPNGAGKSVLVDLIARLISPDSGRVLIDGQDISKVSLETVRRAIGIVSPDLPLLSGSLEMNIGYRQSEIDASEMERIRRLCAIDELVAGLPLGEKTRIREGGRNLSAGQRQRILLARALMGAPRILLLDEVDAHLDVPSRKALNDVIRVFSGTVVWVTHQQIPLVGVDAIWRIDQKQLSVVPIEHMYRKVVE